MTSWRIVGVLSGAAGLGAGELVAGFVRPDASPFFAVGDAVVDLTPVSVKDLAIEVLGPAGKLVLLAGIAVVLAACGGYLGRLAARQPWYAATGVTVLGGVGVLAAVTRPDAGAAAALPSVAGAVVAVLTLRGLASLLGASELSPVETPAPGPTPARAPAIAGDVAADRRRFLVAGSLVGAGAVGAAVFGRWFAVDRFGAARSRTAVRLPSPASSASAAPRDPARSAAGLSRYHTPNKDFYRVDTALTVPQVAAEDWELRIHGMVERQLRLTYPELLRRPMIERDITLACVSNPVGGPYVGNARWIGVPVRDLLDEAGVDPTADQVVSRSYDGMTIGTPTAALTDGRDAILAVGMNGEPLPLRHGFPVRMVVPGLYGYVSACKWLVELEATTFSGYDAYWVKQGWARRAEVKTASRIDTPRAGAKVSPGIVTVAGVAWAQHRGIDRVEVRVDDEPWRTAELGDVSSIDTWRQWIFRWRAEPGVHRLRVRATDGDGNRQTGARQDSFPDGATGWHEVEVTVQQ